jgi:phosphatidate cytidylyltransferase
MAYFTGVKYGKHKMIPRISPNKTWEGAFGGYVSGFAVSLVFGLIFLKIPYYLTIFLSLTIPIVSQLGDLAFSSIKRHFDKKDFGSVFPGHGGVLDRLDSLLFTIIYSYAIFYMFNLLV